MSKTSHSYVDQGKLYEVSCPEWTDTWHPIPHAIIVDQFNRALETRGIGVRGRKIAVWGSDNNMGVPFGGNMHVTNTLDIPVGSGSRAGFIKFDYMSSVIKRFKLMGLGGIWKQICSNGMMGWSWMDVLARKHTQKLDYDILPTMMLDTVDAVVAQGHEVMDWQESLTKWYVNPDQFKILAFNMIDKGVLPVGSALKFRDAVAEETEYNYGYRTLYEIHSGVTQLLRDVHPGTVPLKNQKLKLVCDEFLNDYKLAA